MGQEMSDFDDQWNEILTSLAADDIEWILAYEKHNHHVAKQIIELDDYVQRSLNGEPDIWTTNELQRLVRIVKSNVRKDNESRGS
jgi:hypothetical protein